MRRQNWKFRRQYFISFVLFQLLGIISSINGGIIKKESIENENVSIPIEKIVTTESVETSTDFSILQSTPLIAISSTNIANDIRGEQNDRESPQTTTVENILKDTTTESLIEILKIENTEKSITEADTTTIPITEKIFTVAATDVPTTKSVLNLSNNTEGGQMYTQTITSTENVEAATTEQSLKLEDDNDSTSIFTEKITYEAVDSETTTISQVNYETQTQLYQKDDEDISKREDKNHSSTITNLNEEEFSTQTNHQNNNYFETTTTLQQNKQDIIIDSNSSIIIETSTEPYSSGTVAESTNYDIATNEIKNITISIKSGEKRAKLMKDSNMTLPDAPEVWALAGMTNIENTKEIEDKKLSNITDEGNALPEINSTGSTKLLADWTQIMKEKEFNNNNNNTSIKLSPNSIENILEINNDKDKFKGNKHEINEHQEQENQVISIETNPQNLINQSLFTTLLPNSRFSTTVDNIDVTTPSIEKNQVEDVESEYVKNKRIKIKDNLKNNSIKDGSQIRSPTADEYEIIDRNSTVTSAPKTNKLEKMIESTTHQVLTTTTTTTTPVSLYSTMKSTTEGVTLNLEINKINNNVTTTHGNLIEVMDAVTSTLKPRPVEISSSTSNNILITTESVKQLPESSTVHKTTEPTTEVFSSLDTSSTTQVSSSLDVLSTTEINSSTQTESYSLNTNDSTTSEMSSTQSYDEISSSTIEIPSSTIKTQVKSGIDVEKTTTPTGEYSQPTTVSFASEISSTIGVKITTTGESIESNAIYKTFSEPTTTTGSFDQLTSETSKMSTTTFIFTSPSKYDTTTATATANFMNTTTEEISTTTIFQNTPTKITQPTKSEIYPKSADTTTDQQSLPITTTTQESPMGGMMPSDNNNMPNDTDYNVIIAISVSVVGIIALVLLVGFLYVMRKRQKNLTYGQRCRPVSLDAYSLDNVSVYNSVRRKGALRASKRSYGNVAFDDPSLKHNLLNVQDLSKFVEKKSTIYEEFKDVPQITARPDEVPQGCEDKNRYANVIPLPETRVLLQKINDNDDRSEYINANYVRGPKDSPEYYIACQAPLESTVTDFWRMIWEQNSRVIIMATDLIENGKEKCAEYLPPSITIDNHVVYGDFQITLKCREVKEKYAVSTLHVKNTLTKSWREITHFWYQWPEIGVPNDEAAVIAMLLEARSCLKISTQEQTDDDEDDNNIKTNGNLAETNGNIDKSKIQSKIQGPLTVHCSPGTGRTGTIIACDIALRSLETPKRSVDIPQIVYYVRRGRASAVQTKEQYEFIYRVSYMYATKISDPINET